MYDDMDDSHYEEPEDPDQETITNMVRDANPLSVSGRFGVVKVWVEDGGDWEICEGWGEHDIDPAFIFIDAAGFGKLKDKTVSLKDHIQKAVDAHMDAIRDAAQEAADTEAHNKTERTY